jgi:hypothetical protein
MNAITKKECEKVSIKYVYISISNSEQFDAACLNGKHYLKQTDQKMNNVVPALIGSTK